MGHDVFISYWSTDMAVSKLDRGVLVSRGQDRFELPLGN